MAKKNEPVTEPVLSEDVHYEAELARRNPGRRIVRFDFPSSVREARAVYIFELKGKDELVIADAADANMTADERKSFKRVAEAEHREAVRFSVCGLIDENGMRIFVDQSKPFLELDDWSQRAWVALRNFHAEVNAIPSDELGKAIAGARRLDA